MNFIYCFFLLNSISTLSLFAGHKHSKLHKKIEATLTTVEEQSKLTQGHSTLITHMVEIQKKLGSKNIKQEDQLINIMNTLQALNQRITTLEQAKKK